MRKFRRLNNLSRTTQQTSSFLFLTPAKKKKMRGRGRKKKGQKKEVREKGRGEEGRISKFSKPEANQTR